MKIGTFLLLVVLAAITVFAMLNWSAFMMPTTISLGVAVVQAPLGLIMLGLIVLLTALFLMFVVYMQTSALLGARRHARELHDNRELANQAETSRFNELHVFLEMELKRMSELDTESRSAMLARIDQLEHELRSVVEQSGNTLTAYIGELEDRLERGVSGPHSHPPA